MSKKRRRETKGFARTHTGKEQAARAGARVTRDDLRRAEWGIAITLTLVALLLHIGFLTHAGALWRDEVNTAEYARMSSLHEIYASLPYDGFPPLAALILRGWIGTGLGASDQGLRWFGFLVGVAFLGAVWMTCRLLRCPTPLFSLALVGLGPQAVRAVDSIRPYGLGMVFIVATLGLMWRAVESPSVKRFLAAGTLAVLSVQCMYQNAFLLLGICAAGAVVSLKRSDRKAAGAVVGVGVAAALSLLPYGSSIAGARNWNVVIQSPTSLGQLVSVLIEALGPGGPATAVPWFGLFALCVWVGLRAAWGRSGPGPAAGRPNAAFFGGVLLIAGTAPFLIALKATQLQTQPWYYIPLLATLAPALDAGAWAAAITRPWRIARLVLAVAIAAVTVFPEWRQVTERRTNMDVVAARVGSEAAPGDLILVSPWYYGVSFHRYYKGQAEWQTIPPLEDLRIHRYDLLKAAMARPDPMGPVLDRMAETLISGHRLWLVGVLPDPRIVEQPAVIPPAPNAASGWYCGPYLVTWAQQASFLLRRHAVQAEVRPAEAGGAVNPYENVPVIIVSGWQ